MTLNDIRKYFLWTMVGACVWISLAAIFGLKTIGVIGSAAFMIAYYWMYYSKSEDTSGEKYLGSFANSFYFQGFLLTIWALIITMIVWGVAGTETLKPGDVLSQVGIALVTTFIGLGGRTWMVQFIEVTDEIQRAAEHQLSEKAATLAGELSSTIRSVREVRVEFVHELEVMKEAIQAAQKQQQQSATRTAEAIARSFHKDVEAVIRELSTVQSTTADNINALSLNSAESGTQLVKAASQLEEASSEIGKVAGVQKQLISNLGTEQLQTITKLMEQSTIGMLGNIGDVVQGLEAKIGQFRIDGSSITEAIMSQLEGLDELTDNINERSRSAALVLEQAQSATNSVTDSLKDVGALTKALSNLPGVLIETEKVLHTFGTGLVRCVEGLEKIDPAMVGAKDGMSLVAQSSEEAEAVIREFKETLRSGSQILANQIERT